MVIVLVVQLRSSLFVGIFIVSNQKWYNSPAGRFDIW